MDAAHESGASCHVQLKGEFPTGIPAVMTPQRETASGARETVDEHIRAPRGAHSRRTHQQVGVAVSGRRHMSSERLSISGLTAGSQRAAGKSLRHRFSGGGWGQSGAARLECRAQRIEARG